MSTTAAPELRFFLGFVVQVWQSGPRKQIAEVVLKIFTLVFLLLSKYSRFTRVYVKKNPKGREVQMPYV